MANIPVTGYPTPGGSKIRMAFDHFGPASYVQYSTTGPAGDIINASDLGMGGFDNIGATLAGYSNSGNYIVTIQMSQANDWPVGSNSSGAASSAGKRATVQWFTTSAAFGAKSTEATATTNLSAESVRIVIDGV